MKKIMINAGIIGIFPIVWAIHEPILAVSPHATMSNSPSSGSQPAHSAVPTNPPAQPPAAGSDMQRVVQVLQQQIQQVANSIPAQLKVQQASTQQQMLQIQKQLQTQIVQVQKQVQQLQNEMVAQIKAVQKQIHDLSQLK